MKELETAPAHDSSRLADDFSRALKATTEQLLSAPTSADPAQDKWFPSGINYLQFTLKIPNEVTLIVSGTAKTPGLNGLTTFDAEGEEDTVPRDADFNLLAAHPPIETLLELPTDGMYGTGDPARRYGTARTVEALKAVGREWHSRHPSFAFGIGDISKKGGGDISGHVSHEKGVDVDVRILRTDGKKSPTRYQDREYSRELTRELIELFLGNTIFPVKLIFFNDPEIRIGRVQRWPKHDNHLHVRFNLT